MPMKTYTIKVDEELHHALRHLKAGTVRQILKEAINSDTFKKEMLIEFEKQMQYYLKSMEMRFKEASDMKNKIDIILKKDQQTILAEIKKVNKNEQ